MDPWTTTWWHNQAQQQAPHSHSPHTHAHFGAPPLYYTTPPAHAVPLPSYPWDHGGWNRQHAPQVIPCTHRLMDGFMSKKYPEIHPILAIDTSLVRYDVRYPPADKIQHNVYHAVRSAYAIAKPCTQLRLVSKDFPWAIDIKLDNYSSAITCENVWDALYRALQEPIMDSEWGIISLGSGDRKRRESIERAAERRRDRIDRDRATNMPLKRIDWLGDSTIFKGVEKDEDFAKRRLLPNSDACADTWLVRFGS